MNKGNEPNGVFSIHQRSSIEEDLSTDRNNPVLDYVMYNWKSQLNIIIYTIKFDLSHIQLRLRSALVIDNYNCILTSQTNRLV